MAKQSFFDVQSVENVVVRSKISYLLNSARKKLIIFCGNLVISSLTTDNATMKHYTNFTIIYYTTIASSKNLNRTNILLQLPKSESEYNIMNLCLQQIITF